MQKYLSYFIALIVLAYTHTAHACINLEDPGDCYDDKPEYALDAVSAAISYIRDLGSFLYNSSDLLFSVVVIFVISALILFGYFFFWKRSPENPENEIKRYSWMTSNYIVLFMLAVYTLTVIGFWDLSLVVSDYERGLELQAISQFLEHYLSIISLGLISGLVATIAYWFSKNNNYTYRVFAITLSALILLAVLGSVL